MVFLVKDFERVTVVYGAYWLKGNEDYVFLGKNFASFPDMPPNYRHPPVPIAAKGISRLKARMVSKVLDFRAYPAFKKNLIDVH